MSFANNIICPSCGASIANGGEFYLRQAFDVFCTAAKRPTDDSYFYPSMHQWIERATKTTNITCETCGHRWSTKAKMPSIINETGEDDEP